MHKCTDLKAYFNSIIEQNKEGHITGYLGMKYRKLSKNVLPDSNIFFGDDIAKKLMNINN